MFEDTEWDIRNR